MTDPETNSPEVTPYNDPALISAAGGDESLLSRLVAQKIAEDALASDPDNEALRRRYEMMTSEVNDYRDRTSGQ